MKLLARLSLTVLSLLLLFAMVYLLLPSLVIELARYKLDQQGFSDVAIKLGNVGLESTSVEYARLSNNNYRIELSELKAEYQIKELLAGTLDSIHVESLALYSLADQAGAEAISLPSPETLSGLMSLDWQAMLPGHSLNVQKLLLYDADGNLSLNASAEFSKSGRGILGEIKLVGNRNTPYRATLEVSPESRIDIQLFSNRNQPLSIKLKTLQEGQGLSGTFKLDLAQIAEMIGQGETLTGSLDAEIAYYSDSNSPQTSFEISAKGQKLGFSDVGIQEIQAIFSGHMIQQKNGYQLEFAPSSNITMHFIKQGENTLDTLQLSLPHSINFAQGNLVLPSDPGIELTLSKLNAGAFSVEQARFDAFELSGQAADASAESCRFKVQLTSSLIEIADIQIESAPLQIEGPCPDREESKWSIKAKAENINYEDASYRFFLSRCELQLGNSDHGKLLDPNPTELGGTFACQTSQLGGELISEFRFNPLSNTGQANFSILGLSPDDEAPLIDSVVKDWALPFEIVSGSLSAKGVYRWWINSKGQSKEKLLVDLDVTNAGGHYEGILFSGLNYQDSMELLPQLATSDFSRLSVEHIDIAVPITQASANIRLSPSSAGELPTITIDELLLLLLNGEVSANTLEIDLNSDQQNLLFIVKGLDLAQIVSIQQLDGLSATGRLNGSVPVRLTSKGVKIIDGKIYAQAPGGQIQYLPAIDAEQTGKSIPGSDLVLKILQDLNYDSLSVNVDYDEDGELRMKLAIKGKSPQVDTERPIHFNLDLEQNLLTLLKGLRYAEGINDDIDKNVQKYFEEQKNSLN